MGQNTEEINLNLEYDFVFIGMGASNSLILRKLIESNILHNKKVAVIEAAQKNENDKTYCFWAAPNDSIVNELSEIISHSYNQIEINKSEAQSIQQYPYYYIRSIDLYQFMSALIAQHNIPVFYTQCQEIKQAKGINALYTDKGIFYSKNVFDSRAPKIDNSNHIHLHQSFYGLQVKFEKDVFNSNTFEMMNFDVEQNHFTQFFYILPFSKNEALIELTRFGSEKIDIPYAKKVLSHKIESLFGSYQVVCDEVGCIPMTNYQFPASTLNGVLNTGARANLIKPSTGYGFKNMFYFAEEISKIIPQGRFNLKQKQGTWNHLNSKKRFKFYDSLLLIILLKWPHLGKDIFSKLFKAQKISTIFSFLDEKTSLFQEIRIFASLPFKPFIKAAFIQIFKNINYKGFGIALALIIYILTTIMGPAYTEAYMYLIIVAGLLLIGIPHGAVDHLLQKNSKPLTIFIVKYLLIIQLNFSLWMYSPSLALTFFILYSAYHFGESELENIGYKTSTIQSTLQAISIGTLILLIIVFGHWQESILIIKNILKNWAFNQDAMPLVLLSNSVAVALAFIGLFVCFLNNKKHFFNLSMLLLIGLFLPLPLAFSLYFIGQHSYNAWQHLKTGLNLNSLQLYKKAWPYLLGAFAVFLAIMTANVLDATKIQNLSSNFFIFLSCISLPHVLLMHVFYQRTQK